MTPGTKGLNSLALIEKYTRLAFSDGKLGAEFYFSRTLLGYPVYEFLTRLIEPFYDFQKNDVVFSHR